MPNCKAQSLYLLNWKTLLHMPVISQCRGVMFRAYKIHFSDVTTEWITSVETSGECYLELCT